MVKPGKRKTDMEAQTVSPPSKGNPPVGVRLPPDIREAANRAAEDNDRAVAWLMRRAFEDWLAANGYLPPKKRN